MKFIGRSANTIAMLLCLVSFGNAQEATKAAAKHASAPVDLGTLGGSSSQANAVSLLGGIAGVASLPEDTAQHAFLKYPGKTTLHDLGTLEGGTNSTATAVNAFQKVAGFSDYDDPINGIVTHGFFYDGGRINDVGTLGGSISEATAINNFGLVAGISLLEDEATTRAFVYCAQTKTITDLGVLKDGNNSTAYGINDLGFAAGSSETGAVDDFGSPIVDAVIFNVRTKQITDLGNLGASPAQASAINDLGWVVGFSAVPDGSTHGFYWNGGKLTDIGSLGGTFTQATAINIKGEAVGFSNITGDTDTHAFAWSRKAGIVDLNSVIPTNSGWVLNAAYGVNFGGEIVGVGTYNGESHAFSLKYPLN